ncbi:DUF502 domain-containing protein [Pseudovibrio exalbescens]|uniref:DUF502 domain-containing protein n=1 Tax=Pseudovibrio exalbescens TaxID=197461 RepID=A0A1U7JFM8_9HYPH|nr:DUF502 domain-containing protein [Pseudovibrio exalbescens]OKL43505.1 hypothetical protein A3843_12755 [Pseudovibrio exalbescens]
MKRSDSNSKDAGEGESIVPRVSALTKIRNYFLTGLVVAGPIGITLYLSWSLIQVVDGWVKPIIPAKYNPDTYFGLEVPGVGLIAALVTLTLIGFLTANIAGRTLINLGERVVARMPLVRNLYSALKQIFETVLRDSGQNFTKAALIEYPRPGLWAVVFVATSTRGEVATRLKNKAETVSVFLPTTPNPTSGFLLFVPKEDVIELSMSVEDAAKLVISAGLVSPDYPEILAELGEEITSTGSSRAGEKRRSGEPAE